MTDKIIYSHRNCP